MVPSVRNGQSGIWLRLAASLRGVRIRFSSQQTEWSKPVKGGQQSSDFSSQLEVPLDTWVEVGAMSSASSRRATGTVAGTRRRNQGDHRRVFNSGNDLQGASDEMAVFSLVRTRPGFKWQRNHSEEV